MAKSKNSTRVLQISNKQHFRLRYARSFIERLLGWRVRGQFDGVWLVPCSSIQTFSVKESFDVIWLDKNNNIVRLDFKVRPNRILGCLRAHSVIELPAGTLAALEQKVELFT
ncbi:MAG TPA: DUF192 domain-containing protein [Aliidiomarina sp.]|nr:DUF192 domain-containing protein [Aliidiomarina sp.]